MLVQQNTIGTLEMHWEAVSIQQSSIGAPAGDAVLVQQNTIGALGRLCVYTSVLLEHSRGCVITAEC